MAKKKKGLEVKKGRYVMCVPVLWRTNMHISDPEYMCSMVAKQTFGKKAKLVELESQLYAEGVAMLEKVCEDANSEFKMSDPVDMICKIDGDLKYVRIVDARGK